MVSARPCMLIAITCCLTPIASHIVNTDVLAFSSIGHDMQGLLFDARASTIPCNALLALDSLQYAARQKPDFLLLYMNTNVALLQLSACDKPASH